MNLADLELPLLELAQPAMFGDRLHSTLAGARAESWIVRNNDGVAVLEREAAEFFLKSPALEFPGAVMMELMGYSQGGTVLGFYSAPVGPGLGPELASPERLFDPGDGTDDDDAFNDPRAAAARRR